MTIKWYNPQVGAAVVSIANYGITFSSGAVEALGNPRHIMLGFDDENKCIVVKPCDDTQKERIEFASKKRDGYVRISNKDFIRFILSRTDNLQIGNRAVKYLGKWDKDNDLFYVCLDAPLNKQTKTKNIEEKK